MTWLDRRRRSTRIPVRTPLTWRLDGREIAAWTADVSRHGLLVTSPQVPPTDALIQVDLTVQLTSAGRLPVSVMARVRWARDNPVLASPSTQFGVQILAFRDPAQSARYAAYVESLIRTLIVMEV
jgi:PilZ domain